MTPCRLVSGYGVFIGETWPHLMVQVIILGLLATWRLKNRTLPILLEPFTNTEGVTIPEDLNLLQTSLSESHIAYNRFIHSMWFYVTNAFSLKFYKFLSVMCTLWNYNTTWFWRFADRAYQCIYLSTLISVYLSQYLTNLMHKICFTINFISCLYMFRAHVLIIRRSKLHYTASGIITPICGRLVHEMMSTCSRNM